MENPWKYDYFVYARPAGEKRYLLTNLHEGATGMNKVYAPRYKERDKEAVIKALDATAAACPGWSFQLRKLDGKTVVYTTAPA